MPRDVSWVAEIATEIAHLQLEASPRAAGVGLVLLVLLMVAARFPRTRVPLRAASFAAATAWGLWLAWSVRWLCDDAHISFRYAKNLLDGHGLVFNPHERIEGYTNFLWTLLLALFGRFASIPHVALVLGPLSYLALGAGVWRLARSTGGALGVPLAAVALLASRPFSLFATSGLETLFALALAMWAAVAWNQGKHVQAGLLFALGAMARPDHLLLAAATWLVTLASTEVPLRVRLKTLVQLVLPTVALFSLYWLARWAYYGDFFPNTFRAKSGGGAYWSQGFVYLTHGVLASGLVLAVPWVLAGLFTSWGDAPRRRLVRLGIAVALTHGLYSIRVGGDFMEYRFLLPTFALLLVALEAATAPLITEAVARLSWKSALVPLLLATWAVPLNDIRPIGPGAKRWYLAAEETFYPLSSIWPSVRVRVNNTELGEFLRREIRPTLPDVRFAIGVIGIIGYVGGIPLVDTLGLTSRIVASQPLSNRGRPGHEKLATIDSLLAERASFSDGDFWPGHEEETRVNFGGFIFFLVRHDPALQELARRKGWHYPDALIQAAQLIRTRRTRAELEEQREFYRRFLEGTPVAGPVLALVDARLSGAHLRGFDPLTLSAAEVAERLEEAEEAGNPLAHELAKRVLFRRTFEDEAEPGPEAIEGDIWPPVAGSLPNQQPVSGFQGRRLVNTYHRVDLSTGRLEWTLPTAPGAVLSFLVGGGGDCSLTAVALFDEGREVARWCGEFREQLRWVHFALTDLHHPRISVIDASTGGWGHVLADDFLVVAPPADRRAEPVR